MLEIAALTITIPVLVLIRHSISYNSTTGAPWKKTMMQLLNVGLRSVLRLHLSGFSCHSCSYALIFYSTSGLELYLCNFVDSLDVILYSSQKVIISGDSSLSFGGDPNSLRAYIKSYRVIVMIITCLCILAVDFKIFPRRYAKTETYGTSLAVCLIISCTLKFEITCTCQMDLGVGAFVLANSLVSRQARNISSANWKTAMRSISPLIILGFIRLVTMTGVDYQVHVGEYGVYWNFFFTIAAVSILTSLVDITPQYCGILGSLVLVGYQFCLVHRLSHYLLSNERGMDIISQNKEGLYSIFGYWGMYLVGVYLGNYLFYGRDSSTVRSNRWVRMRTSVINLFHFRYAHFRLLTVLLDRHVERISRRTLLSVIMLADHIPGSKKTSILEEALSRNLLATFLLANVLTALVNLS
ncbi:hypothetical protein L6164_027393 [Bauhinia variegata]|uniref:Uncharacterized protein n=1 Tax=Bauhinia variegata TaxID=167791 RepID=A0ACB9LT57_BAUVA|nr:hypothetical protein L6164_027393 [Bauhinia variegata]